MATLRHAALVPLLAACTNAPPDAGGRPLDWHEDDEVAWVDGPTARVRVHYSDRGPNAVDQSDEDEDGVPDRAQDAAVVAEEVLDYYAFLGFAPPVPEAEVALDAPGGSDALDVYLMDTTELGVLGFAANEACVGERCAVFVVVMHNDASIDDLVAHELFHVVQGAYDAGGEPGWLVEGTAERAADPFPDTVWEFEEDDIDGSAYLERADCGLEEIRHDGEDRCSHALYGTALLWSFLEAVADEDIVLHAHEASVTLDGLEALDAVLGDVGTSVEAVWPTFAAWNLATGPRAPGWPAWGEGHVWAPELLGVVASAEGAAIHHQARWAPLSARYFRLDHAGGALWIGTDGPAEELVVTVHPVAGGAADGPVDPAQEAWGLPSGTGQYLGEYPAGGLWLSVSHPVPDGAPRSVGVCLGDEAAMAPCAGGCGGCATPAGPGPLALVLAAGLWRRRQNPGPPRTR